MKFIKDWLETISKYYDYMWVCHKFYMDAETREPVLDFLDALIKKMLDKLESGKD